MAELGLGRAGRRGRDEDLRPEPLDTEARVLLGLLPTQAVVHVQRGDAVAERAEHVPEAGRVGAARDEARHLAAGGDQVVPADVLLDARAERGGVHMVSLGARTPYRSGATSQPSACNPGCASARTSRAKFASPYA